MEEGHQWMLIQIKNLKVSFIYLKNLHKLSIMNLNLYKQFKIKNLNLIYKLHKIMDRSEVSLIIEKRALIGKKKKKKKKLEEIL